MKLKKQYQAQPCTVKIGSNIRPGIVLHPLTIANGQKSVTIYILPNRDTADLAVFGNDRIDIKHEKEVKKLLCFLNAVEKSIRWNLSDTGQLYIIEEGLMANYKSPADFQEKIEILQGQFFVTEPYIAMVGRSEKSVDQVTAEYKTQVLGE